MCVSFDGSFNSVALRKAKIVYNFGLSECNRVKAGLTLFPSQSNFPEPFLDWKTIFGYYANNADPIQMPQNVESDLDQHW